MEDGRSGWIRRNVEEEEQPQAAEPEAPAPVQPLKTFVDPGAEFVGTLRLKDGFQIDSEFRGAIESEGTVVVGAEAGIEASIKAREVIVFGAVVGDVSGSRQVILRAGSKLHGDVETPCLEIERGATFNGKATMVRPEVALRARLAARATRTPAPPADPAAASEGA